MEFNYKEVLESTKAELQRVQAIKENLKEALDQADVRIEALTTVIHAIGELVGDFPSWGCLLAIAEETGKMHENETATAAKEVEITPAIRETIEKSDRDLSVPDIRDILQAKGWEPGSYANPLATIHTVIKRLIANKEVKEIYGESGKVYRHASRKTRGRKSKIEENSGLPSNEAGAD